MDKLVQIGRRTFVWAGGLLVALTAAEPVLAGGDPGVEVPEPSTLGLVAAGAVAAAWLVRRNRRK